MFEQIILFVGYGYMGRTHGITAINMSQYKVLGLVEINTRRVEIFKQDYPNALCFSNLEDALEKIKPQIVFLSTGIKFRSDYIQKSLNFGSHVFVEKPLALTQLEYQNILNSINQSKRYLKVGYILREQPAFQSYIHLIQRKFYNQRFRWEICLTQYHSSKSWESYSEKIVSPFVDSSVHYIDLFLQVCKNWKSTIQFVKKNENKTKKKYQASMEWKNSLGSIFHFSLIIYFGKVQKSVLDSKVENENQKVIFQSKKNSTIYEHELYIQNQGQIDLEKINLPTEPDRQGLNYLQHLKLIEEIELFEKTGQVKLELEELQIHFIEKFLNSD